MDRKSSIELMSLVGLSEDIVTFVRRSRLRWHGHMLRRNKEDGIRRALEFEVEGVAEKVIRVWDGGNKWRKTE